MTNGKSVVLVIDDDPSILRALRRLISGAGYQVQTFDRPSELLKKHFAIEQTCLLADFHLPEMNAVELCKALATSGRSLPTILMTAHSDEHTLKLARRIKPVALLIKPFARDLLLQSISAAFGGRSCY